MTSNYDGLFANDLDKKLLEALALARRSCINCAAFDLITEGCGKFGGARPPAMVIAKGCEGYESGPPF